MQHAGSENGSTPRRPLEGIRILEYAIFHAGPGASAILGDMGAEIIKIEAGQGDPVRIWTQVGKFSMDLPSKRSLMYELSNRNKKGITLDIKQERGKEVFHRLLKNSDVFLTNLRKTTKDKLGLDYETISKINPQIIHANVSGFGPEGPMNDLGAFDPMGQAISGMMFATGTKDPSMMQVAVLDQATAIATSHAIMSSLYIRERYGIGQEVHVSLYSTAIWLLHANMLVSGLMNVDASVGWERPHNTPLRNNFCCKDGNWVMGVHHPPEKYWETFCRATGQEALIEDPRFLDEDKRTENCPELVAIFDEVFATKTRDEWMGILMQNGLMFCPIQRCIDVLKDPQAIENNYMVDFDHPDFGTIKIPGFPIHFSSFEANTTAAAPSLGQHTDEVLSDAGYSMQEIDEMRQSKVI